MAAFTASARVRPSASDAASSAAVTSSLKVPAASATGSVAGPVTADADTQLEGSEGQLIEADAAERLEDTEEQLKATEGPRKKKRKGGPRKQEARLEDDDDAHLSALVLSDQWAAERHDADMIAVADRLRLSSINGKTSLWTILIPEYRRTCAQYLLTQAEVGLPPLPLPPPQGQSRSRRRMV